MELKQFTDEQLTKAFANSNFGKQSKRDTILKTLSSIAKGYCSGSFSMAIVAELGLTEKRDTYYTYLTDLGLEVLLTNQSRIRELEEELLNFKLELQTFIIVHEPWENGDIDGDSLMDFGISMGVGVKEQYSKEKHGEYLCESYDIQEGDEISWFDPEMLTKGK